MTRTHLIRGTRQYRDEMRSRRQARRAEILIMLYGMGPCDVYSCLLGYTRSTKSQKAVGWARHLFKEIFGGWPGPRSDVVSKEPPPAVLEWIQLRPKSSRKKSRALRPLGGGKSARL